MKNNKKWADKRMNPGESLEDYAIRIWNAHRESQLKYLSEFFDKVGE